MNTKEQREIDFNHLKLMIDVHRHMAVLSYVGLALVLNTSTKLLEVSQYKMFAAISVVGFFICIASSVITQFNHVDASKNKIIYTKGAIPNNFAWPIILSVVGLALGIVPLAFFVLINWA